MSHTNYWHRPENLDAKQFTLAIDDCRKICGRISTIKEIQLAGSLGEGKPEFTDEMIAFNGCGDESYESFVIRQVEKRDAFRMNDPSVFAFCKTAAKPYDLYAQTCLIVFKHFFDELFRVSSDGSDVAWNEARGICQDVLGFGADFVLDK